MWTVMFVYITAAKRNCRAGHEFLLEFVNPALSAADVYLDAVCLRVFEAPEEGEDEDEEPDEGEAPGEGEGESEGEGEDEGEGETPADDDEGGCCRFVGCVSDKSAPEAIKHMLGDWLLLGLSLLMLLSFSRITTQR